MGRNLYFGVAISPYRVDFCNALHDRFGFDIFHMRLPYESECFDIKDILRRTHFENAILPSKKIGGRFIIKGLKKILRESNPEIVIVPEFSFLTLQVIYLRRQLKMQFKLVVSCDDCMKMIEGSDYSFFHKMMRHFVPPRVDNLILVNDKVASWYRSHFGKGLFFPIIYDENDFRERLEMSLPRSFMIREEMGLAGKKVIVFIGRLIELKRIPLLMKAFSAVRKDEELVIIGDGECRETLENQSPSHCTFVGSKSGDELFSWYSIADILVLPSRIEAFGAVVAEALTAGCPVIVSEAAGATCMIHENENGSVFTDEKDLEIKLSYWMKKVEQREAFSLRKDLSGFRFNEEVDRMMKEIARR